MMIVVNTRISLTRRCTVLSHAFEQLECCNLGSDQLINSDKEVSHPTPTPDPISLMACETMYIYIYKLRSFSSDHASASSISLDPFRNGISWHHVYLYHFISMYFRIDHFSCVLISTKFLKGTMLCLGGVVMLQTQRKKEKIRALLVVNPPVSRVKMGVLVLSKTRSYVFSLFERTVETH